MKKFRVSTLSHKGKGGVGYGVWRAYMKVLGHIRLKVDTHKKEFLPV